MTRNGNNNHTNALAVLQSEDPTFHAELSRIIHREMGADRFAMAALTMLRSSPQVVSKCDGMSILIACLEAAQHGLSVDPKLGEFYFVPYGKKCTGIIGYRGMMAMMYRSGGIKKVDARAVFEGDEFEFEETQAGPRWSHKPYWDRGKSKGKIRLSYAYAILKNGEIIFKVADQDQIARSRAKGNSGTWRDHEEHMTIKTAFRQMFKWVPRTALEESSASAIEDDEAREMGEDSKPRVSTDWARQWGAVPPESVGDLQPAPGLETQVVQDADHGWDTRDADAP